MPRRRKSGVDSESFSVRWHSVANTAMPSADIMSSPDPLTDNIDSSVVVPPSTTRRVARSSLPSSQWSSRFSTMATSPRKQMFELEVGDDQAPQKLLVTVETEEPSATAGPGSARRKLFQTSSPLLPFSRRREMATTTTVPLKKAIEEEDAGDPNATPRKRGRPRKTNGTPLPGAGTKRKSGTPIKRTPRRPRTTKGTDTTDQTTETNAQPTPGTKRRGRPPKNRAIEPSSELGTESNRGITSTVKGRRRRQALAPEEVLEVANEAAELPPLRADDSQAGNEMTLIITPSEAEGNLQQANRTQSSVAAPRQSEPDSDIWMATLDDEPTPRPESRTDQALPAPSSPGHGADLETSEFGDYGYLAPAGSDVSSADEPQSDFQPRNNDTIANEEDFSMIFMDSLPSLQANLRSSVQEVAENDIGEETSMIINNTLESLRQSLQERDKPGLNQQTNETPDPPAADLSRPQGQPQEDAQEGPREEVREQPPHSSIRPPMTFSPNRNLSPRWLRSPRRMGSSPLRRQVLKLNARENAEAATNATEQHQSPVPSEQQGSPAHVDPEESNLYDDSFSEIPEEVLEAATPRRPRRVARHEPAEEDVEMEDAPPQPAEEHEDQEQEETGPRTASNASVLSRSDAGRLPTPDNTPPQIEAQDASPEKSTHLSQASTKSSLRGSSPLVSSPEAASTSRSQTVPEIVEEFVDEVIEEPAIDEAAEDMPEETMHDEPVRDDTALDGDLPDEDEELPDVVEPQHVGLSVDNEAHQPEVTPLNQMTSPVQDPQSLLPEGVPERVRRPTLSPIVRAGRALQSVTSDPPSPEAREQQLRSPFRSSVSRELGPREAQSNRRMSTSPGRSLAFPAVTQIPSVNEAYEDPFSSGTRHTGQASFMEALERSGGDPSPRRTRVSSRDSTASSMRFQPPSETEMSWVANEGPISDNLRGDVPLEAFGRPTGSVTSAALSNSQVDGAADEPEDEPEQDDDMDIWEFEAQRSSSHSTRQRSREKKTASPIHRRSALPSPWTKRAGRPTRHNSDVVSERRVAQEEEQAPDGVADEGAASQTAQVEEYSLLTQKENTGEQNKAPESAARTSRFDLSSFFSSPAAIPGMLAEKFLPVKKMSVFGARPVEPEPVETEDVLPTSSMFPQVPQKEFHPRASPRKDLFSSPLRSVEPEPRREELEERSREPLEEQEQEEQEEEEEEED
ncbi:hypothetical protein FALBO_12717, partial [Fusarium albosuccineum]